MKTKVGFTVAGYVKLSSLEERATILRYTHIVCLVSVACSPRQCSILLRWWALLYSEQRDITYILTYSTKLNFKPSFRETSNPIYLARIIHLPYKHYHHNNTLNLT